jgi:hypothetical protein
MTTKLEQWRNLCAGLERRQKLAPLPFISLKEDIAFGGTNIHLKTVYGPVACYFNPVAEEYRVQAPEIKCSERYTPQTFKDISALKLLLESETEYWARRHRSGKPINWDVLETAISKIRELLPIIIDDPHVSAEHVGVLAQMTILFNDKTSSSPVKIFTFHLMQDVFDAVVTSIHESATKRYSSLESNWAIIQKMLSGN